MKINPRKIQQQNINELYERVNQVAGGMSLVMQKIEHIEKNMGGLEEITMKLAEFLEKREEFNKYLENWLKVESETSKSGESVNNGELLSGSGVSDKPSASDG